MESSVASSPEIRAMSSIFVSNIVYDVSEDILKAMFSEVGPVLNFRVITDKNPNNPKIAFCEYKDPQMALTAIQSLNGFEIKGHAIHVDLATSEKCRQEIEKLQAKMESTMDITEPTGDKAPEEISKAVASLPAEQMFELMKQMKMCIENNPQEARNLLLQNPQLAYALLQAQVIMRIVDPSVAIQILNRPSEPDLNTEAKVEQVEGSMNEIPSYPAGVPPVSGDPMSMAHLDLGSIPSSLSGPGTGIIPGSMQGVMPGQVPGVMSGQVQGIMQAQIQGIMQAQIQGVIPGVMPNQIQGVMPGQIQGVMPGQIQGVMPGQVSGVMSNVPSGMTGPQNLLRTSSQFPDQDHRSQGDQDLRTLSNLIDHDMRIPPTLDIDKDMRQPMSDQDFRSLGVPTPSSEARPFDPRFRNMQAPDRNIAPGFDRSRPSNADPRTTQDPRNPGAASRVEDPRKASMTASINSRLSAAGPALQSIGPNAAQSPAGPTGTIAEEQEKAALIMQVLQLTDQQIAALPPEQRQSILILKDQLARSHMI